MIKHLIIGGCSFSTDSQDNWPYHLFLYLRRKNNIHLTMENISYPSQGQDRIQKKLTRSIIFALKKYKPEDILVCVMWSGLGRRCWYVDNPLFINEIIEKSVNTKGSTYFDQLTNLENDYNDGKKITVVNREGLKFNTAMQGGWVHTKSAGQVPFDFLLSEFCLNQTTPGESLIHYNLEHIIALQNFCSSKGIPLLHQFYMDNVYQDILKYKDYQIVKYLYKQLNLDRCITKGMFEYLNEIAGIDPNLGFPDRHNLEVGREYFIDGFHPSSKSSKIWVDDQLIPLLKNQGIVS